LGGTSWLSSEFFWESWDDGVGVFDLGSLGTIPPYLLFRRWTIAQFLHLNFYFMQNRCCRVVLGVVLWKASGCVYGRTLFSTCKAKSCLAGLITTNRRDVHGAMFIMSYSTLGFLLTRLCLVPFSSLHYALIPLSLPLQWNPDPRPWKHVLRFCRDRLKRGNNSVLLQRGVRMNSLYATPP
jgi:hypothetical protein